KVAGGEGRALPADADFSQEVVAGGRALVELFVAPGTVVADGGSADQCFGSGCGRCQAGDEVFGADDAAIANALLFLLGPAARGDGLAGEVENRVDAG